ncbi:hypothetical protein JCM3775_006638 [Rhodotorula graminis]
MHGRTTPAQALANPHNGDLDMLEAMMDRMHHRGSSSPGSTSAFPARPSSRASSSSRLSHHSSSRSLHSLQSSHAVSGPSYDSRHARTASGLSDQRASVDDDRTPSVAQGEWGSSRHGSGSIRSATPSSSRYQPSDDAASAHSLQSRAAQVGVGEDPSRQQQQHPAATFARPEPTSLRTRPRTATSPIPFERSSSPLRLLPRSPTNDRTPLEDLSFFREVGALVGDDPRWDEPLTSPRRLDADDSDSIRSGTSSVLSGPRSSSLRAARLREDIEKEALRIKERASLEELRRNAAAASAVAAGHRAVTPDPPSRHSSSSSPPPHAALQQRESFQGSMSGIPLYPGAPVPSASSPSSSSAARPPPAADSRSVRSLGSTATASGSGPTAGAQGSSSASVKTSGSGSYAVSGSPASGSGGASARTEYGARSDRSRQTQSREWSQTCWVWVRDKGSASVTGGSSGSSGGGRFSKAPLIRDVPAALKRKGGKRESAHHLLSPAEALLFNVDDSLAGKGGKSSSKDKDKGREKAVLGPAAASRDGRWRRATGVLRDDGYFRVLGESDKAVVHNVHLPSLGRSDVRLVDHSLFGRPNCISMSRSHAAPPTPHRHSFSPSASSLPSPPRLDETVYLCFPSVVATQVWLVMAQCFARPEFYLSSGAAAPRPLRSAVASDSGTDSADDDRPDELESGCRIFRSLHLSIAEGRALGELATEVVRPGPKSSWERPVIDDDSTLSNIDSYSHSFATPGMEPSPSKSVSSMSLPRLASRHGQDGRDGGGGGGSSSSGSSAAYCEIEMGGEVIAQTSVRKGSSPYWNESFVFSDLPPFVAPVTIRVLQMAKHSSRPVLIGSATVRIPDLPRQQSIEDWWAVKPPTSTKSSDVVGELSLGVRVNEEVVLPSRDYDAMLQLLSDDADADLATDIAHEFPSDLEEVTRTLMRIYQAESVLLSRILRLADLEIDHNALSQRSAAILFRGNSILTKSVELYLRLTGAEYLDASIGEVIRRIVAEKVEIEIDPMKLRPGTKDKELQHNVHLLREWALTLFHAIYDAREKCPHDLRQIFAHIQGAVIDKYGEGEDQKNTRWTCVSAFIFLRFFVPAVLNPKLFFIVPGPPDPKSQRTLTLVAKTLQGLANFSSFGQKEPWMLPMNAFVQDNTAALVDFIEHVSTPAPSTAYRQEWTSPNAAAYLAPARLRSSLPPLGKEGVPLLPHLIDLPRELGVLATRIARLAADKGPLADLTSLSGGGGGESRCETPSVASSRGGRSRRFVELVETCIDVHVESRRRGGGLVSLPPYEDLRNRTPDPKTRTRRLMTGRPAIADQYSSAAGLRKALGVPPLPRTSSSASSGAGAGVGAGAGAGAGPSTAASATVDGDELHIRNPASNGTGPSPPPDVRDELRPAPRPREESETSVHSTASRRTHRGFTINGADSPGVAGLRHSGGSYPTKSFSTEDLSLLASLQTGDLDATTPRRDAPAPFLVSSQTMSSLAGYGAVVRNSLDDEEADSRSSSVRLPGDASAAGYAFPPAKTRVVTRGDPASAATATAAPSSSGRSKSSASSTRSSQIPPTVPTSRIRITQETTTTTTYVSDPAPPAVVGAVEFGTQHRRSVPYDDDTSLAPTSPDEGTPFESSFGTSAFSAPLMRANPSQSSQHSMLSVLSGRSLASSASTVSISAEITAGPGPAASSSSSSGAAAASAAAVVGRRASSAGMSLAGMGRRATGSVSGPAGGAGISTLRDDQSDGGSSGRGGGARPSGSKGGLLSRAMGRKGSHAS